MPSYFIWDAYIARRKIFSQQCSVYSSEVDFTGDQWCIVLSRDKLGLMGLFIKKPWGHWLHCFSENVLQAMPLCTVVTRVSWDFRVSVTRGWVYRRVACALIRKFLLGSYCIFVSFLCTCGLFTERAVRLCLLRLHCRVVVHGLRNKSRKHPNLSLAPDSSDPAMVSSLRAPVKGGSSCTHNVAGSIPSSGSCTCE